MGDTQRPTWQRLSAARPCQRPNRFRPGYIAVRTLHARPRCGNCDQSTTWPMRLRMPTASRTGQGSYIRSPPSACAYCMIAMSTPPSDPSAPRFQSASARGERLVGPTEVAVTLHLVFHILLSVADQAVLLFSNRFSHLADRLRRNRWSLVTPAVMDERNKLCRFLIVQSPGEIGHD